MSELLTAVAIALFLEGAAYALFPDAMKRAMLQVLAQPSARLRQVGLGVAVVAVIAVWLMRA